MSAISQQDIDELLLGDASISLLPRNFALRMDLAIKTLGSRWSLFGAIWLLVALPSAALTYYLVRYQNFRFWGIFALALLASAVLGAFVGTAMTPSVLGEPITWRTFRRHLKRRWFSLLAKAVLYRVLTVVGLLCFFVPGWIVWEITGHFVERRILKAVSYKEQKLRGRRQSNLVDGLSIMAFCGLLWLVVYVVVEAALYVLFDYSIIIQAIMEREGVEDFFDALGDIMNYEPEFLALAVATGLLVYVVGRIAWFLNYVDARVRGDCWDIELALIRDAKRLESLPH